MTESTIYVDVRNAEYADYVKYIAIKNGNELPGQKKGIFPRLSEKY